MDKKQLVFNRDQEDRPTENDQRYVSQTIKEVTLVVFFLYLLGSVAHRGLSAPEKQTLPPAEGMSRWRHAPNLQESEPEECKEKGKTEADGAT